MKTLKLLAVAALALSANVVLASAQSMENCMISKDSQGMKAWVVDANGKSMNSMSNSTMNNNMDSSTTMSKPNQMWVSVPMGECAKINMGDFSGVSADVKDKVMGMGTNANMSTNSNMTTNSGM